MSTLLAFLFLGTFIALVVGLVNPARVKQSSRKRVWLVFGGTSALFLILFIIVLPPVPTDTAATETTSASSMTAIATTSEAVVATDAEGDISTPTDVAVAQAAVSKAPASIPAPPSNKAGPAYLYPNPSFTPGVVLTTDAATICATGYASSVRNVSVTTKKQVYAEYGLSYPQPTGSYEVDHFIPLEIGGSNDIKNLWPEPASPTPGFHQKDQFENFEHDQICSGKVTVQEAQSRMVSDWYYYWQVEVEGITPSGTATVESAPAPIPAPQPIATASSSAAYYTSSYYSSKYYYPAACTAWQGLSSTYRMSFSSLDALLAKYPDRTLAPGC